VWRSKPLGPDLTSAVTFSHGTGRRLVSRVRDGELLVFDLESAAEGGTAACAVFPVPGKEERGCAVCSPDGSFAAYCTAYEAARVGCDGSVAWRARFEAPPTPLSAAWSDCVASRDGTQVWVYRPDAMLDRGEDTWLVLDARDGAVLAQTTLPTVGQGAHHVPLPDGSMLLEVGEGQDGVYLFRGHLESGALAVHEFDFDGRCLIGASPSGGEFMSVGHAQRDATFHRTADGAEIGSVDVERIAAGVPALVGAAYVSWNGGYLTDDSALIIIDGEQDGDGHGGAWHRAVHVDIPSGALSEVAVPFHRDCDVHGLGDGTWITVEPDGSLARWSLDKPQA
jgi:hypothetical protein